jgi:hypothetical protein
MLTVGIVYSLARSWQANPYHNFNPGGRSRGLICISANLISHVALAWESCAGRWRGCWEVFLLAVGSPSWQFCRTYLDWPAGPVHLRSCSLNVLQFGDEQAQQLGIYGSSGPS